MKNYDDELHSEKVRGLLGEMPSSLVRWSTVVLTAIFVILLTVMCIMPYPYSEGESIMVHLLCR
ncbi:MAG: hypothetical protein K2J92_01955 [Muribaculaceae bacterium]|nr:hypothetical protein [Muribaculaceae bacterium]MDE6803650.1 hypothetical protein [Muribaculaceae bacterium]MDE6843149.1 hypothetical protein [Muribaculaceae bacterium]MDE7190257.1 hypothetical protein [Muribaculaceae bacterium]